MGSSRSDSRSGSALSAAEPAAREAAGILARVTADELAADQARRRNLEGAMSTVPADSRVAGVLEPGEVVLAIRVSAAIERREPPRQTPRDPRVGGGPGGRLYLTSQRLILLGQTPVSVGLEEIRDAVLSGERLLLVLRDGRGVSIETSRPRLLRVEIAAARSSARS